MPVFSDLEFLPTTSARSVNAPLTGSNTPNSSGPNGPGFSGVSINVLTRGLAVDCQSQHTVIMAFSSVEDQLAGPIPFDGKPQFDKIADLARSHEQVIGP